MNQPKIDLSPKVSDEIRKTTCYMCACRCGINVHLQDGKGAIYRGQPGSPGEQGCALRQGRRRGSCRSLLAPARLKAPMKRVGPRGSGEFEEISLGGGAMTSPRAWLETDPQRPNPEKLACLLHRAATRAQSVHLVLGTGTMARQTTQPTAAFVL